MDYARSYRANVARMQLDILEAVKSGRLLTDMREDDIFDQYTRHLVEGKCWERRAAEELIGRTFHRWNVFYKELAGWVKDQVKIVSEDPVPIDIPEAPVSFPCKKPVSEYRFMIVFTRGRKIACLHKASGGCSWTKVELNDYSVHDIVVPEQYNKRCKLCWSKDQDSGDSSDTSSPSD